MTSVIVDSRISYACERALMRYGFNVMKLPACGILPDAIASHPDTLICRIGNTLITTADYCDRAPYVFSDLREWHGNLKIHFCADSHGNKYPKDAILNALVLGNTVYARRESISSAVTDIAKTLGYKIVDTRQGYPACTTLAFSNGGADFAVTSDEGMAKILKKCNVKVTKIAVGGISLAPYDYGFIGGASGVYKDKIYFFGDISAHESASDIIAAAKEAGYECVSLSGEPLCDLGGMIFID